MHNDQNKEDGSGPRAPDPYPDSQHFFYTLSFLVSRDTAEITFENVVFEYVHGQKILNGMSFTVPAGQNYAIVGGKGIRKKKIQLGKVKKNIF